MTPPSMSSAADLAKLFRLDGRIALVTGGTGGLGSALAKGLALAGARVAVGARTQSGVEATAAALRNLGAEAIGVVVDVCDPISLRSAADVISARWGSVDILVNGAGGNRPAATAILPGRSFFQIDPAELRAVMELNFMGGAVLPTMVFGERMVASGRAGCILNVTSVAAKEPLTRVAGYAAAKAAVANFTQWLAVHFARDMAVPIRVNSLMPGFFLTEQNRFLLTGANGAMTERGARVVDHTPMGRFGEADELVGACVYLCSDAASFVTGSTIVVDGGFTAYAGV